MAIRPALAVLAALSLAACESDPLSYGERRALQMAEARWAARGFQDYSFEMLSSCFCGPVATQWARVEVVSGQVSRVVLLATGTEVTPQERSYFMTIERVFSEIREANTYESLEDVSVQYDRRLGFPTQVGFQSKPNIADGGATWYLRNAGPLP